MADMAMYGAWGNVKDAPKNIPRYWDVVNKEIQKETPKYTVDDVLDIFEGKVK